MIIFNQTQYVEKLSALAGLESQNKIHTHNLFLIQGTAGSGKSTLLKQFLALNCNHCDSQEYTPVPILLSAIDFFEKYHCNTQSICQGQSSKKSFNQKKFNSVRYDFYIDGLDELMDDSHRKLLLQSIQKYHGSKKIRVFITSRIIEKLDPFSFNISLYFKIIDIANLTPKNRREITTNYLKGQISNVHLQCLIEQITNNPMFDSITGTPGFLSNLCVEYKGIVKLRENKTTLSPHELEDLAIGNLYKQAIKYILEEKEIIRGNKNRFNILIKHIGVLYDMAAAMFLSSEGDETSISGTEFDRVVEQYCKKHDLNEHYMKRQIKYSNLLYPATANSPKDISSKRGRRYNFIQPSFEGYFLAEYLHTGHNIRKFYEGFEKYFEPSVFTEGDFFIFRLRECDPDKFYGRRCHEMLRFYVNRLDVGDAETFLQRIAHIIPVNIEMDYQPDDRICGNLFDTFDFRNFLLSLDLMKYVKQKIDDEPFILLMEKYFQKTSSPESFKKSLLIKIRQQNPSIFSKLVARHFVSAEPLIRINSSDAVKKEDRVHLALYSKNWPSDLFYFFNPQLQAWLIRNHFNLTPQSFLARWKQIETQHKSLINSGIENLIESVIDRKKKRQEIWGEIAKERYQFYKTTKNTIMEIIGKNGDAGKLKLLENSGLPCEPIKKKLHALSTFLTDEFENSVGFWYVEHYRHIKNFKKAMEKETDYLKKKLIRDIFFDEYFELKRCQLSIANQARNFHQGKKDLQLQIDEFISREIGLPQGDLSLEIVEAGHMETYYICLRKSGKITAVFTGWPQEEKGTEERIFYAYLCASHPELPGLRLGTRLHEHFFNDNEMRQAEGKSFYNKFIGSVNPFGREAYFHIHKLGATCKVMIERNKHIAEKFPYYGGIIPHRFRAEFSRENHKLAIERLSQVSSLNTYTPKAYHPPTEENILYPDEDLSRIYNTLKILGDNETILLNISMFEVKFDHLSLDDYGKQEIENESSLFYDHCVILFKNGYQIIDCYFEERDKTNYLGYVFAKYKI